MYSPRYVEHTQQQLRSYGFLMAVASVLLAGLSWWRAEMTFTKTAAVLGGAGCLWLVIGLVAPLALRPIYHGWMWLAFVLNFVVSRVLLTILFFVVLLPASMAVRVAGKDPLDRARRDSYWKRCVRQAPREHFERLHTVSAVIVQANRSENREGNTMAAVQHPARPDVSAGRRRPEC